MGSIVEEINRDHPPILREINKRLEALTKKVDVRLPGKGNSNSLGARPVHLTITMIKWIRTSRFSMKNSLLEALRVVRLGVWTRCYPRFQAGSGLGVAAFGVSGAVFSDDCVLVKQGIGLKFFVWVLQRLRFIFAWVLQGLGLTVSCLSSAGCPPSFLSSLLPCLPSSIPTGVPRS